MNTRLAVLRGEVLQEERNMGLVLVPIEQRQSCQLQVQLLPRQHSHPRQHLLKAIGSCAPPPPLPSPDLKCMLVWKSWHLWDHEVPWRKPMSVLHAAFRMSLMHFRLGHACTLMIQLIVHFEMICLEAFELHARCAFFIPCIMMILSNASLV